MKRHMVMPEDSGHQGPAGASLSCHGENRDPKVLTSESEFKTEFKTRGQGRQFTARFSEFIEKKGFANTLDGVSSLYLVFRETTMMIILCKVPTSVTLLLSCFETLYYFFPPL